MLSYRKDIKMAVALLCNQVIIPDEDDWGNLVRVLRHIRGTLHLPLILQYDSMRTIQRWVGISFSVHIYCKGNTGEIMSTGPGSII